MSSHINADDVTLGSLFREGSFYIPPYQREFEWNATEAKDFLMDLIENIKDQDTPLFLGAFTLVQGVRDAKHKNYDYEVVDGQQRITSIVLLAIALSARAREITNDLDRNSEEEQEINSLINEIRQIFLEKEIDENGGYKKIPKLIASPRIEKSIAALCMDKTFNGKTFSKISSSGEDLEDGNSLLKKGIKTYYDEFKQFDFPKLKKIANVLRQAVVIQAKVDNHESAYHLFEVLNARGKDLEISDLLKNHIFSKHNQIDSDLNDVWGIITDNAGGEMVTMLRHFYFVEEGEPVSKKELYRNLKNLVTKRGIQVFINNLDNYAMWHKEMNEITYQSMGKKLKKMLDKVQTKDTRQDSIIFKQVEAIKFFDYKPSYPLIYSYFRALERICDDARKTKKTVKAYKLTQYFLSAVENYLFVNFKVSGNITISALESSFATQSKIFMDIKDRKELGGAVQAFVSDLEAQFCDVELFKNDFSNIRYGNSRQNRVINYILQKLNDHYAEGIHTQDDIFGEAKKDVSIDHWCPSKETTDSKYEDVWKNISEETKNSIGNLIPLVRKINGVFQTMSPQQKMKKIDDEKINTYIYTTEFIKNNKKNFSDWNTNKINNNSRELAELAFQEIWNIEVKQLDL